MAKFYHKNNINLGIGLGLLLPITTFYLLHGIYILMADSGLLQTNLSEAFRQRTIALLAIATDIFLVQYYRKNRLLGQSLRGVLIAMAILSIIWMIYFLPDMFAPHPKN